MTQIYKAPKPKFSFWERFKFIAIRTIFPPLLLWDLVKLGANKLLGTLVGSLVLPAQNINFNDLKVCDDIVKKINRVMTINNENLFFEKYEIITHDDAHLDTFEVQNNLQQDIEPRYQKYIINLVGNGMCYEQIIQDMK